MKIAIIAHLKYPIAEPFVGGLEMHTFLLAERLSRRGHIVTLFAADGSQGPGVVVLTPPTSLFEPIDQDKIEDECYAAAIDAIKCGGYDLVHFNALHGKCLLEFGQLGLPLVVALHTPPFDPLQSAVVSLGNTATFVSVSNALRDGWSLNESVTVVPNGIDLARFAFTPLASSRKGIWSGRIVPEKGLHLAIEAATLACLPLDIAGPIIDFDYWTQKIEPQLNNDVRYLGHLSHDMLALTIGRAAVALCTPVWEEPFGLVVTEALACGTPVAGFKRGALPDILDSSCGSLAERDDVAGLAAAIERCLSLERRACRRRAERLFDAEVMVDRYEAIYRSVITPSLGERDAALTTVG